MAEIRKFNPADGNAIQQALRAAMGEPVRPNEPGAARAATERPAPAPSTVPSVVTFTVTTKPAPPEDTDD